MLFPEKLRIRENSRISGAGNSSGPVTGSPVPAAPPAPPVCLVRGGHPELGEELLKGGQGGGLATVILVPGRGGLSILE